MKNAIRWCVITATGIFSVFILFVLVWQLFPSVFLRPYNAWTERPVAQNVKDILDQNKPEYVDANGSSQVCFRHVEIDPTYYTEGASVADINNDGLNDIVTGNYWYEAPEWRKQVIRPLVNPPIKLPRFSDHVKSYFSTGNWRDGLFEDVYPDSFFTFHGDINKDGWVDVVAVDKLFQGAYWFENPQGGDKPWVEHKLISSNRNESPIFFDVLNKGAPQLVIGFVPEGKSAGSLALIQPQEGEARFDIIDDWSKPGADGSVVPFHGLGSGDINGDGLIDIILGPGVEISETGSKLLTTGAWYEQQTADDGTLSWKRHGIDPMIALSEIQVMDVDHDGDQDFVGGMAHDRGLYWFEQGERGQWIPHVIDDTYTQLHSVIQADMNGDGVNDIIAGKTAWAHFGMLDPDEFGPKVLYWYEKDITSDGKVRFIRHLINKEIGVGRQVSADDIDQDGLMDIAVGNRNGVHIFIQKPYNDSACIK